MLELTARQLHERMEFQKTAYGEAIPVVDVFLMVRLGKIEA